MADIPPPGTPLRPGDVDPGGLGKGGLLEQMLKAQQFGQQASANAAPGSSVNPAFQPLADMGMLQRYLQWNPAFRQAMEASNVAGQQVQDWQDPLRAYQRTHPWVGNTPGRVYFPPGQGPVGNWMQKAGDWFQARLPDAFKVGIG